MSRTRAIIGFWLVLILSLGVFPYLFFIASKAIDSATGQLQGLAYPLNVNLFAAACCVLAGLFWILWGYSYLHFVGKGTPIEAFGMALYPTKYLVTTGPYAYTRNPMVFGFLSILLAVAFYTGSVSGLILVPLIALLTAAYLRAFEEPYLEKRFGAEYLDYRTKASMLLPARPRQ